MMTNFRNLKDVKAKNKFPFINHSYRFWKNMILLILIGCASIYSIIVWLNNLPSAYYYQSFLIVPLELFFDGILSIHFNRQKESHALLMIIFGTLGAIIYEFLLFVYK